MTETEPRDSLPLEPDALIPADISADFEQEHSEWQRPTEDRMDAEPAAVGVSNEAKESDGDPAAAQRKPAQTDVLPKPKAWVRVLQAVFLAIGVLLAMGLTAIAVLYFGMRPIAHGEYGEPLPDASVFAPRSGAAYLEVPDDITEKGLHRLTVSAKDGTRVVWLWVWDTVAPKASGRVRLISSLQTLRPDELVENLSDADRVKVSFAKTPPFGKVGDYEVPILLEDASGNQSSVTALLYIRVTNDGVTVEAGDEAPMPAAFLWDDYAVESYTEITADMLHTPGTYPITLTVGGTAYPSKLKVVDTVAPKAETAMVVKTPDETVTPEDFLTEILDETEVTATFLTEPDLHSRAQQTITIRLTDRGGNTTDVSENLLLTHAKPLTIEARTEPLTVQECLPEGSDAELVGTMIPNKIGTFAATLLVDGEEELCLIEVHDTVPPEISTEPVAWYVNHPLEPEALCAHVYDVTGVTVTADSEIDWTKAGTQMVALTATDAAGNTASATVELTLSVDREPPELYGVINRSGYVGEPIAYFAEVFAEDNLDGTVDIQVDNSKVNLNRAGTYPVQYTATDSDGNSVSASCQFKIVAASVTDAEVEKLAKAVLEQILKDGMTRTEKLEAIFNYVRSHVRYVNSSDKNDWRKEAKRGFTVGKGDCFTFYSVTRALLDQIDVEYMSVTRKGGGTRHYWVIVNVGTGWYHFDPTYTSRHKHRCFMWTNQQCKVKAYFWRFEESLYPEIATEPFDKKAVIAAERAGTLP